MNRQVKTSLPTKHGDFDIILFSDDNEDLRPHFALVHKEISIGDIVPVRIHSECLTGDILGSLRCDCGEQLDQSLKLLNREKGILLYLRQEGRGIGLINKMHAYNLQDQGLNTVDANLHLGFEADARHYEIAIEMLVDLNVKRIRLITNNPEKITSIENSSIELVDRIPLIIEPHDQNKDYLSVKKEQMGHLF